jgi:preprotein translocase subunit SecE
MAISARRRPGSSEPQIGVIRFLRETYDELRKVVWPTPQELYRYTIIVIVTVVVLAMFVFAVDQGLTAFLGRFVYGAVKGG